MLKTITDRLDQITDKLDRLIGLMAGLVEGERQEPPKLLTIKQVAKRLNVSVDTVRNLDRCGKLPASRIGEGRGTLRFDPELVEQYEREAAGNPLPKIRRWAA
jgi:excisionase family DNA binding protein